MLTARRASAPSGGRSRLRDGLTHREYFDPVFVVLVGALPFDTVNLYVNVDHHKLLQLSVARVLWNRRGANASIAVSSDSPAEVPRWDSRCCCRWPKLYTEHCAVSVFFLLFVDGSLRPFCWGKAIPTGKLLQGSETAFDNNHGVNTRSFFGWLRAIRKLPAGTVSASSRKSCCSHTAQFRPGAHQTVDSSARMNPTFAKDRKKVAPTSPLVKP